MQRTVFIFLTGALLALSCLPSAAAILTASDNTGLLTIGIRGEVRPFSFRLAKRVVDSDATRGPLSHAGYGGYMVRICDAVLAEMLTPDPGKAADIRLEDIRIYDLDTDKRLAISAGEEEGADHQSSGEDGRSSGPAERRFEQLGKEFDILCDPATITNAQREFIVSPPLFLSGIGYLIPTGLAPPPDPCGDPGSDTEGAARQGQGGQGSGDPGAPEKPPKLALIGMVEGTTAASLGLRSLVQTRELPQYQDQLIAVLQGENQGTCREGRVLIRDLPNHLEAARQFCERKSFFYYLGDLEIIRTYAESIPGCRFENGAATYTNDRYAIFGKAIGTPGSEPGVTRPSPDRQVLVARFFEILSQKVLFFPSVLDKAYDDTFPGKPKSQKLQYFYWSIRGESRPDIAPLRKPPQKGSASGGGK
jgi:hypothetical protein